MSTDLRSANLAKPAGAVTADANNNNLVTLG
jgi:hypothetical protein